MGRATTMNPIITVAAILSETVQKSKWIVMILGVNLGYHSKKALPFWLSNVTKLDDQDRFMQH
jgi:hypothetical protein